jgi:hypothetical protein
VRTLVLVTFRPGYWPVWAGWSHVTVCVVNRQATATRRDSPSPGWWKALLRPGEIVAGPTVLFIEEVTKTVLNPALASADRYALAPAAATSGPGDAPGLADGAGPGRTAQGGGADPERHRSPVLLRVAGGRGRVPDEKLRRVGSAREGRRRLDTARCLRDLHLQARPSRRRTRVCCSPDDGPACPRTRDPGSDAPKRRGSNPELLAYHATAAGPTGRRCTTGTWRPVGQQRSANAEAIAH